MNAVYLRTGVIERFLLGALGNGDDNAYLWEVLLLGFIRWRKRRDNSELLNPWTSPLRQDIMSPLITPGPFKDYLLFLITHAESTFSTRDHPEKKDNTFSFNCFFTCVKLFCFIV